MSSAHAALATTLRSLRLDGRVVLPDDPGWDVARSVWNGMVSRQPIGVIEAASADDVTAGIAVAREAGLPLAIRGGGHNVAGNGTVDGGLVIDLRAMNAVTVDPATRIVTVGGGATLGDLDRGTVADRTVVPAGVVSGTGVGGLTLGGGMGWLTRAHGLTIDRLESVDVVAADGRRVTASADEHPDLLWGLRGGGGNFGVATTFRFRGVELGPDVHAGATFYRRERWAEALRSYAAWAPTTPDELTTIVTFMTAPVDGMPGDLAGQPVLLLSWCWGTPDLAAGARATAELVAADPPPDHVAVDATPWLDLQSSADAGFPWGAHAYFKSTYLDELDEAAIDTIVTWSSRRRSSMAGTDIHQLGGAYGRVADDATAFGRRDARYILNVWGVWEDGADDAREVAWVRDFWTAMQPHATGGHYVNFLGLEEGPELRAQIRDSYLPSTWERLVGLKDVWDPTNLFRLNHNIPPTAR
jgi:FAD/FMN-containing dehydrogenase